MLWWVQSVLYLVRSQPSPSPVQSGSVVKVYHNLNFALPFVVHPCTINQAANWLQFIVSKHYHGNMLTISQNQCRSNFNCLNYYTLLHATCQTPFNPNTLDIEWKFLGLALRIAVGTLYQIQSEAPRSKYRCSYASNQCLFLLSKLTSPVTSTTASAPSSTITLCAKNFRLGKKVRNIGSQMAGGSGGVLPQENFDVLRLSLVASETLLNLLT